MNKKKTLIDYLTELKELYQYSDYPVVRDFAVAIGSAADFEVNISALYDYLQSEIMKKDSDFAIALINDLLASVQYCEFDGISQTHAMITNETAGFDYFITFNHHETGAALKTGIKDFSSIRVLNQEQISLNEIYSGLLKYLTCLPGNLSEGNFAVLIRTAIYSLLTIIDLCWIKLKQHSDTAQS